MHMYAVSSWSCNSLPRVLMQTIIPWTITAIIMILLYRLDSFNAIGCYITVCYCTVYLGLMCTNSMNTSTSDLYLCQTPLILQLYLHFHRKIFRLAVLLNFMTACNNTSISGTYTLTDCCWLTLLHVPLKHTHD